MTDTLFNPGLGPLTARPIAAGKVFFVASGGSDVDSGINPNTPFASITYALTQCVADRGDYIYVLDNVSANEAAFPVALNVTRIHLLGLSSEAYPYTRLVADTVNNTLEIGSVQHYEIAGFELGGGDNTVACINSIAGPNTAGRAWIHHCTFAVLLGVLACNDGIHIENTFDWCMSVVEDCYFCGSGISDGIARDGIRIEGNSTRGIFRRNIFRQVQGSGIHCIQNGSDIGVIQDNIFRVPDNAAGEAIYMELGVGNAIIVGNRAGTDDAIPASNPFRDSSVASPNQLNAWIDNQNSATGAAAMNIAPAA